MATGVNTGMRDEHYDIISALYHALQGAETTAQYINDAEQEGDSEAIDFFKEVQDHNRQIAERAKRLLAERVK